MGAKKEIDLFCRINVQADMPYSAFVVLVARCASGARHANLVSSKNLDISVDENDIFDAEKSKQGAKRWLYYPYTLEIDAPAKTSQDSYVAAVGSLLQSLWSCNLDAVASCEFESSLPRKEQRTKKGA
jgi:hypothetical protein